jgi:long-chain acyl-CoA synthetase
MASSAGPHVWEKSYPDGVDWNAAIPTKPLHGLLEDTAGRYGERPCIDFLDRKLSYSEVHSLVRRMAQGLQQQGLKKGDRVGLFLPNCPYFVIAYFAILTAGGVVVNFNPLYADHEVAKQIDDSGVELMVTLDVAQVYDKLARMLGRTGLKRIVVCPLSDMLPTLQRLLYPIVKWREVARFPHDAQHLTYEQLIDNAGQPAAVEVEPGDVAVLQYTGGTTGTPKGAMLTHANLYANTVQSALWFHETVMGQERQLGVLPLFHVFAMTSVMNLSIYKAAEMILLPRFNLDEVLRVIQSKKPTLFPAVPTIYTAINNHPHRDRYDLSSIKFCISGGAPLPLDVKHTFEKVTGCALVEGYGLSECSPVATVNPLHGTRGGSIGLPVPGTVIEIMDVDNREREMPTGERGEVCISGPQVMKGYWNRPEETAQTLVNGRLHTGDVGYMDEDGFIFIVDRIKDLILAGGYNVYPRNVEEAIYLHPAVRECIVLGVPDAYRGQTVKAYIALAPGQSLTVEELKAFLGDKLSPIEMPKAIEFRPELPKTMIGKLSRKALQDEMAAGQAKGH